MNRIAHIAVICAIVSLLAAIAAAAPVVQNDGADFILVEAEATDAILNPDKDDNVHGGKLTGKPENPEQIWKAVDDPKASGGKALLAPSGGRRTAEQPPESFAVYKIQFKTPGTYYLYFRARNNGTPEHGASDSLFMASKFGANAPMVNTGINNKTGEYSWRSSGKFLVLPVDMKSPVEYRIDVREAAAHVDAFLWSKKAGLDKTPEELDKLADIQQ